MPISQLPIMPVLFNSTMERPEDGEAATIAGLNDTLLKISQTRFEDFGHATRSVHAKSHGVLRGELHVASSLPAVLAQGLFAKASQYPLVMRLSTLPGDILDDNVSTPRGMAIKIIGVEGARLPGSEADATQDLVLVNGPAFSAPTAKKFLASLKMLAATTDKAEGLKKAVSAVARGAEALLEAFGTKSPTVLTLGGQPKTHILGETFYSQVPILYGPYIAKIAVAPVAPSLTALTNAPLDLTDKPDGLRGAVSEYFAHHGGEWEIRIQLCVDLETMPIEDASVIWPEDKSPYVSVGRITIPSQDSWSEGNITQIDEGLSFSPWHGLADHRPLGSVMRARKTTYESSAHFRSTHNGCPIHEPRR